MSGSLSRRKKLRLEEYDYSSAGYYFVTIKVNSGQVFGRIEDGRLHRTVLGDVAAKFWEDIPRHYANAHLDEYVIMPDHVHGIVIIDDADDQNTGTHVGADIIRPQSNVRPLSDGQDQRAINARAVNDRAIDDRAINDRPYAQLSNVIKSYKWAVTKEFRRMGHETFRWQRSFYDHIIRDEGDLSKIRAYIANNPVHQQEDHGDQGH